MFHYHHFTSDKMGSLVLGSNRSTTYWLHCFDKTAYFGCIASCVMNTYAVPHIGTLFPQLIIQKYKGCTSFLKIS